MESSSNSPISSSLQFLLPEYRLGVWQGSWPADLRVVVQGPGGASTATVSAASYVRLEMSLYLHRKVYRRGDTKEILICPGKTVSRWLPL